MKTIYIVFVDEWFVGIAESEEEVMDIAADCTNGTPKPLYDDDIPDRVWWEEVNCLMYKKMNEKETFYLIHDEEENAYKIIRNDRVCMTFYDIPNFNAKGLSNSMFMSITTLKIN